MGTSSSITVDSLLRRAQTGDRDCLGSLLSLYANYLKLLAQAQLDDRVRRRISPSDIVQETLLEAHRDFQKFMGRGPPEFVGWLRKILINNLSQALEWHVLAAKRDVRREVSINELNKALNQSTARLEAVLMAPGQSPGSGVQQQETMLRLADCIALLADEYRQVIIFRHIDGLPFNEIADRMGKTSGAVRMLWLRAIEKLRQGMDAEASR